MGTKSDKPYPRFCSECGTESVVQVQIPYNAQVKHDGKLHDFPIENLPVDQCESCGQQYFTMVTDREIARELRIHLCFLQPEAIRERIRELSLTQAEFAQRIGVAKETVSRWITGHSIQNRAMDNLMRLFFGLEVVRSVLSESGPAEGLGIVSRTNSRISVSHDSSTDSWTAKRQFSSNTLARRDAFKLSGC